MRNLNGRSTDQDTDHEADTAWRKDGKMWIPSLSELRSERAAPRPERSPSAQAMSNHARPTPSFVPMKFLPRGPGQVDFCRAIDENDIVFGLGPQGSGKSLVAIAKAVEYLNRGDVDRIVLYRPYIGTGRTMGFQPGDGNQKVAPYLAQLVEYLGEFYPQEQIDSMIRDKSLVMGAMEFIRSRSFRRSFVLLDEGQNALKPELRVFLGRLGESSKMVICGDVSQDPDGSLKQSDLPRRQQGALDHYSRKFLHLDGIARVEMTAVDIVRHPLVRAMVEAGL